jgi:hypothetical protein
VNGCVWIRQKSSARVVVGCPDHAPDVLSIVPVDRDLDDGTKS